MWDVVAFYENQASSSSLVAVQAVSDDVYVTSGDDLIIKPDKKLVLFAFGYSGNIFQGQLRAPVLGQLYEEIPVFQNPAYTRDFPFDEWFVRRRLVLRENEALNAYVASADGGTAEDEFVVVALGRAPINRNVRFDYVLRLTGSTTLSVGAWTKVTLTPDVTLPEGRYRIVGMRAYSPGAVAVRIIPLSGSDRPGFPGARNKHMLDVNIKNYLGDTGVVFTPRAIPKVEYLALSADTSQIVYWFLKKVG